MDRITPEQRSLAMSKIRGKNTRPEQIIFRVLRKNGIWFRRHYRILGMSPDVVFPRKKIAVFIDGDFWHGRRFDYETSRLPLFWKNKIKRNIERDKDYRKELKKSGWKVLRLWETSILKDEKACLERIMKQFVG